MHSRGLLNGSAFRSESGPASALAASVLILLVASFLLACARVPQQGGTGGPLPAPAAAGTPAPVVETGAAPTPWHSYACCVPKQARESAVAPEAGPAAGGDPQRPLRLTSATSWKPDPVRPARAGPPDRPSLIELSVSRT